MALLDPNNPQPYPPPYLGSGPLPTQQQASAPSPAAPPPTTPGSTPPPAAPPLPHPPGGPPPAAPPPGNVAAAQAAGAQINSNISPAQWAAWAPHYDPQGCPPGSPFHMTKEGSGGGCAESPDNCPPGMHQSGNRCAPGEGGPGGPGGGGPGGGGPGGGPGAGDSASVGALGGQADTLWQEIQNLQSRYSPEVMQRLMAGAKAQGSAAGKRAGQGANLDAIRRGMGRSADAASLAGEASRGAEAAVVNPASSFYAAEKIKGDQEDRIAKLTSMQNFINSSRQHIQASTATAAQKEVAYANLALAQRRLQQELQMQQNQFDYGMASGARDQFSY